MYQVAKLWRVVNNLYQNIDRSVPLESLVLMFFTDNPQVTIKYSNDRYRRLGTIVRKGGELAPWDQIPRVMVANGLHGNIEWED